MTDTEGGEWCLGLRDLQTKSSEDTLAVWKEIMADLDGICANSKCDVGKQIFCSIRATMSDRAATEIKFNKLLEDYLNVVVPMLKGLEGELNGEENMVLIRLNNFFCGLHSLVHFAEVTDKSGAAAEHAHYGGLEVPILNPQYRQAGESGAARTVRTVCKAFSRGGDEKSGVFGKAISFLKPILKEEFNVISLPLTPYRGSRFSILFHNR